MKSVTMIALGIALLTLGVAFAANDSPALPTPGKAVWRNLPPSPLRKGKLSRQLDKPQKLSLDSPLLKTSEFVSDCTVYVDHPINALYDWLQGDELYYAYQNVDFPLVDCANSYPFVVTYVGMTMAFNAAGSFQVQAFLTTVDSLYSSPVCPVPGELLAVTDPLTVNIPEANVYTFMVQLDFPTPVSDNYFAGMYFASDMTPFYPGIAIDSVPYLCINYNDWGYGLTDLASNDYYNFPGTIHLFSVGYSKEGTLPMPRFAFPTDSGRVIAGQRLWSAELNDKYQYASAMFEYFKSSQWWQIGEDFNGISPLRDGVTVAASSDGWSVPMSPPGLNEGNYLLRVTIFDNDDTYSSDTISVYYDKLSLEPHFNQLVDFANSCAGDSLTVDIADENPVAVTFGYRYLANTDDRSLLPFNRSSYGDANGNPADGNHNYNGEYGEYYSAPCATASMLKYWYDKGFIEVMQNGAQFFSVDSLVEKLASLYRTREMKGTQDDNLVVALRDYLKQRDSRILLDVASKPGWDWLKRVYCGRAGTAALAVAGPFGNWMVLKSIDYSASKADSIDVTLYDPVGGLLRHSYLLAGGDSLIVGYLPNNTPYRVDLALGLYPQQQSLTYTQIGTDFNGLDGFSTTVPSGYLQENLLYLIRARALDANDQVDDGYHLLRYHCAPQALQGDADNSGGYSIGDAVYLINYIFGGGPAPATLQNGDADCDGTLTVSDAVYIINFIFASGPLPCSSR